MATIVVHRESGKRYVLLGGGYGAYRSAMPGVLFGVLAPRMDEGVNPMALCSDAEGTLRWIRSERLRVEQVDGVSPEEVLDAPPED